jgi:DNA invertase Pin-like site-specific DNA recombinase
MSGDPRNAMGESYSRRVTTVGYARVSTRDQNPALQHDALAVAGCSKVFMDVASGAKADRPQLPAALEYLHRGDMLVVWQLDRLGRNMRYLIDTVDLLHEQGVQFRSLRENIDTATAAGWLIFHVFAPSLSSNGTRSASAPPPV